MYLSSRCRLIRSFSALRMRRSTSHPISLQKHRYSRTPRKLREPLESTRHGLRFYHAVETINSAITSTLGAAALTLMARPGQIAGVVVDGPLAFDNAISAEAAKEKGIVSEVAGDADIILVPDIVSGNILAKDLEYL